MSEARAVTNFSGNAVATLLIGKWTGTVDTARVRAVLDGKLPFDEATMVDDELAENDQATLAPPAMLTAAGTARA